MSDLISIIIPIYNGEKTINRCISSIKEQSYKNWEAILINDGSTDQTENIIRELADEDSRIVYKSQKNSGVSHARNVGITVAKGKYLAFIDCDDTFDHDFLMKMYNRISDTSADLVICGYHRNDEEHRKVMDTIKLPDATLSVQQWMEGFWQYFSNQVVQSLWNKMYRADIIRGNNVHFNECMKIGEDLNFNLDYIRCITEISLSSYVGYNYNCYSNQTMSKGYEKRFHDGLTYFTNIKEILTQYNCYESSTFFDYFSQEVIFAISNIVRSEVTFTMKLHYLNEIFENEYTKEISKQKTEYQGLHKLVAKKQKYLLFIIFYLSKVKRRLFHIKLK